MDAASDTINRHKPDIPKSMYFGISPEEERKKTKLYRSILKLSGIDNYITKKKRNYQKDNTQLVVTQSMLDIAKDIDQELNNAVIEYLNNRNVDPDLIDRYGVYSTANLASALNDEIVENLSLRIPRKFSEYVSNRNSDGVSIAYYFRGMFCGFLTRFIGNKASFVKYAFTCPSRTLFGIDWNIDEIFVVEGMFDAIAMNQVGYNAAALCDSQPNYFKLYWISKFKKINLLFDNDYAGYLGALKSHIALVNLFDVDSSRIGILLPKIEDPSHRCEWDQISFNDLKGLTESAKDEIENVI